MSSWSIFARWCALALAVVSCGDDIAAGERGETSSTSTDVSLTQTTSTDETTSVDNSSDATADASEGSSTPSSSTSSGTDGTTGVLDDSSTGAEASTNGSSGDTEERACPDQDIGSAIGPGVAMGTLGPGNDDDLEATCSQSGPDASIGWTAPHAGTFQIHNFDSIAAGSIAVFVGDCAGAEITCDYFNTLVQGVAAAFVEAQEGESFVILVEGTPGDWVVGIVEVEAGSCVDNDPACSDPTPGDCVCIGCFDNGFCEQFDDCTCDDCDPYCNGEFVCFDDGICEVVSEGCQCADCLAIAPECEDFMP